MLPPPNWVARSPLSGNGHAGYELEFPVSMGDKFSKAARYLAAIEQMYGKKLNADPNYSGLLCQNPRHPFWQTAWLTTNPYHLDDLAEYVNLTGIKFTQNKRSVNDEYFSLGRNCSLFDNLRRWAYKSVRQYWAPGGLDIFQRDTISQGEILNCELFPCNELSFAEVKSIAKSVATWTWRNMSPTDFKNFIEATHTPEIQSIRGKIGSIKSCEIRSAKAKSRRAEAIYLSMTQGMGVSEIALKMKFSRASVSGWLRSDV